MTDYYPLISRAVTGLEKNTGEARRGLYERARTALVAQLRGLEPPLTESEITRERLALEEAIRKVEAESARRAPRMEALPRSADAAARAGDAARPPPPGRPQSEQSAALRRDVASSPPAPAAEARPAPPAPDPAARNSGRQRFNERSQLTDEGLKGFRDVVAETEPLGEATAQAGKSARQAFAAVPSNNPEMDRMEPRIEPPGLRGPPREQPMPRPPEPPPRAEARPTEAHPAEPPRQPPRPAEPRP